MRYEVEEGSGHQCCFDYSIIDTSKPSDYSGFQTVCECLDESTATLIAVALNQYKSSK